MNVLRRNLRYSSTDNFLFSIMVGAGETFLPAFALAMGLSQASAGMIAALPFLAGSTLQLFAPKLISRVGSYRKWLVTLGMIQAFSFFPLAFVAMRGQAISEWLLYLIVTIYWAAGLASGPAWNSWITSLVPSRIRPRYFAQRGRMGQVGLLLGLLFGGFLLHFAKIGGWEIQAFAGLFLLSGLSRIASSICLGRQSEEASAVRAQRRVSPAEVLRRLRRSSDGRIIGFLLLFTVSINFSAPFFNPFMLKQLNLSYAPYMGLIAALFVAKILGFMWIGKFAKRVRPYRLMRLGIIGTAVLPLLWIFSSSYYYLVLAQVVAGAVGALYELGVMLVLFGAVRDEERTSFLSYYNFASAFMVLGGTTCGAKILEYFGEKPMTYFMIFGLSAGLRFLALIHFDRTLESIEGEGSGRAGTAGAQEGALKSA